MSGMSQRASQFLPLAVGLALALAASTRAAAAERVDFSRDVLPILTANCLECHGPDAGARQAELRLDERASATAPRDSGAAIIAGDPKASTLIARITSSDADERMPPADSGRRLTPEQIERLRSWIEQGAEYSEHWAFLPPQRPELPYVASERAPVSPVDAFIDQQLAKAGLTTAPMANRETLIRRAALDLIGLPPTPEETAAFCGDESPDAWPRLVDRLLVSPHYGERWGRHWLDVARYADSGGFETDIFFGHAWRYRDYVIRALNADKPYDEFLREQIAGDELAEEGRGEAVVATGLFTVGPVLQEAGMVAGKLEYDQLTDAVDTVGSAILGLTLGCARCHDHKYDPIAQREYFGLQALFAASDQFDFDLEGKRLRGKAALKNTLKEFEAAQSRHRQDAMCHATDPVAEIPVRVLAHRDEPLVVRLLARGELEQAGEVVEPGFPGRIGAARWTESTPPDRRRAALAAWATAPENPLTARVIANRVWQWHFGQGIVRTPSDFGLRGERPTHPELLDWLASELQTSGWHLKRLHRVILSSAAYQRGSTASQPSADPANLWLARFQPRRLEAEAIWDSQRAAAGTLNRAMFGLPFAPPLDDQEQIGNFRKWPTSTPAESSRRAVYLLIRRSFRFPVFSAFDLPDNIASCAQRDITTVPNQALTLLNNRSTHDQARAFAERLLQETDGRAAEVVRLAWRYAYNRPITAAEERWAGEFLLASADGDRVAVERVQELCLALYNTSEFVYLP